MYVALRSKWKSKSFQADPERNTISVRSGMEWKTTRYNGNVVNKKVVLNKKVFYFVENQIPDGNVECERC